MSRTPVVGSVDVKTRVASHLSNVPETSSEDFTENFIELSAGEIVTTGTVWALLADGSEAAKQNKAANAARLGALIVGSFDRRAILFICYRVGKLAITLATAVLMAAGSGFSGWIVSVAWPCHSG